MLQQLHIQNYAIIDEITIDFSGRLNIITGETGAGKSILMGALSLILGDRADTSVLLNRDKKCYIEGTFTVEGKKEIQQFLKENDLDVEAELVIRREITSNGKSRAFINDTPVNLSQLQQVGTALVDLHQQFDTLAMAESDFQREVLDALSGNAELLAVYQGTYRQFQFVKKALAVLQEQKGQFNAAFDYTRFLFDELEQVAFRENELEDLETELKILGNSEGLKAALTKTLYSLNESEQPIVQQLKVLANQLQSSADYHPRLPAIVERLQSSQIELQDISDEIEYLVDHVNHDPARIEQINERISIGYKLLKKHGVQTTNELLVIKKQLGDKLLEVLNIDESILEKEKEYDKLHKDAIAIANKISVNRQKQVKPLEEKVNKLLAQVGMPNARLKVEMQKAALADNAGSLRLSGSDEIEFLFDANNSGQFAPIRKVASGGELSRLMLCIKSLVAQAIDLSTLIFDEIDSGISGEAARQVGFIMKGLSASRQIICITHQPQIAGKADTHFYVYKQVAGNTVKTNIKILTREERITTIAQMLSGEKPTAAALENAREMVGK
ncbi:MAG: DNA repair protein RecN [Chitinophagaceae bacterium]